VKPTGTRNVLRLDSTRFETHSAFSTSSSDGEIQKDQSRNKFPNAVKATIPVIPAQAGTQFSLVLWVPACAGMTWMEIGKISWG
jgi:hypothetical protein